MTLLCAPASHPKKSDLVDLIEIEKVLYDREGNRQWVDRDWQESETGDIVSYHNFEETPDLNLVLQMLQERHPRARYYKIATFANSIIDVFRTIEMQKRGVIAVSMGPLGAFSRICAPLFGSPVMYAPLCDDDKNAPGQLLASELHQIYHFRQLSPMTELYGLIGDPVYRSLGHLFHNDYFRRHQIDGVYVKMVVKPDELAPFFHAISRYPFRGLSVTAPLKEAVLPYIDEIDTAAAEIGAVNTLLFQSGKIWGYNTDGDAALDVLGSVRGKRIVVIGAGGAARSIIHTAVKRKADVTIVNRTASKGESLARTFGCEFSRFVPAYDIVINTTSASMPIDPNDIKPASCVMDIALYETEFLKIAKEKKCRYLDGLPMYFQQAVRQQRLWSRL